MRIGMTCKRIVNLIRKRENKIRGKNWVGMRKIEKRTLRKFVEIIREISLFLKLICWWLVW